jgi:hypothetical protein
MSDAIVSSADNTEGSLVAVFVDDRDEVVLRVTVSEGTAYVDELFLRHLVMLISDVGVPAVAFVVSRAEGRPTRTDRRLWRELRARVDPPTRLIDLLVVGAEGFWSASSGRVTALVPAA